MADTKERFAILIRPTGRFETVQLGFDGGGKSMLETIREYFGGDADWSRTNDEYAYFTAADAIGQGLTKNEAAAWFTNMPQYGGVIIVPKKKKEDGYAIYPLTLSDAYKKAVWMQTLWNRECDYRANPERYSFKNKNNAAGA